MQTCPTCLNAVAQFPCPYCGHGSEASPAGGLRSGQMLRQRYQVEKFIAQGGMGSIYKALDTGIQKPCALKELLDEGDPRDRPQRIEQFHREAQILAGLHHPHIVSVWDSFEEGGRHYLVEEWLGGGPLGCEKYVPM